MPSPLIALLALVFWCLALVPFAVRVAPESLGKIRSLEGLRGVLAYGVVAHHLALMRHYQEIGVVELTNSAFWDRIGPFSVSVFFMITGYLFLSKIQADRKILISDFAIGRIFRIYPVYVFACFCAVAFSMFVEGAPHLPGGLDLIKSAARWVTFRPDPPDSDLYIKQMLGASWTLRYELLFYLSLPVVALVWRALNFSSIAVIISVLICLVFAIFPFDLPFGFHSQHFAPFAIGGLLSLGWIKSLSAQYLSARAGSIVVSLGLVALFVSSIEPTDATAYLLEFFVFLPIVGGCSFFGFLTSRPMQLMGTISYSIYFMHAIILWLIFGYLFPKILANSGPLTQLAALSTFGLVVLALAGVVHRYIEKPMINLGRGFGRISKAEVLAAP